MFVRPRPKTVKAFTPPALPGFFAIPAFIPVHSSFCNPPFQRWFAYSTSFSSMPRPSGLPGSFTFTMCCSMLSVTPERKAITCHWRRGPCCLRLYQQNRPAQICHDFGADYQIQRLTLHLATFVQLRASPLVFRSRVSGLTLSILSVGFLVTP